MWELKQQLNMIMKIETPINDKLKQQFNIVTKNWNLNNSIRINITFQYDHEELEQVNMMMKKIKQPKIRIKYKFNKHLKSSCMHMIMVFSLLYSNMFFN
jgi:hypothetical protein